MNDFLLAERIIVTKLMISFIFRNYEEAGQTIRQYQEFFDIKSKGPLNLIYRTFYSGLVAFACMNNDESTKNKWMDTGRNAI